MLLIVAKRKNAAAVELANRRAASMTAEERQESARKAGLVGGRRRAASLTPKRRAEIAKKAAGRTMEEVMSMFINALEIRLFSYHHLVL